MPGIKHLIECHCVLSIYKSKDKKRVYHKFPVYSKIDSNDAVIPKLAKCNNCDTLHYIHDVCKSEIRGGKDQTTITSDISELSLMLPERLANTLIKLETDMSNWDHIIDIFEEERWGESVVLRRDIIEEKQHVKSLEVISAERFKIKNNVITDVIGV